MALKPLRPCRHPGCCVLVSDGYCDAHRPRGDRRSEEAQSWRWMYQTDEWKLDLRPAQLLREPFCRECARHGRRVACPAGGRGRPAKGQRVSLL